MSIGNSKVSSEYLDGELVAYILPSSRRGQYDDIIFYYDLRFKIAVELAAPWHLNDVNQNMKYLVKKVYDLYEGEVRRRKLWFHRFIMHLNNPGKFSWEWCFQAGVNGLYASHKDRNSRNTMVSNLEEATDLENKRNRDADKVKDRTSKYKGVHRVPNTNRSKPWRALYANKHIGVYKTELEAAEAYDNYKRNLGHPEFEMNFPNI